MELSPTLYQRTFCLVISFFMVACNFGGKDSAERGMVTGTYVHTYTAEVIDPKTGETMGVRTVADSIFIKPLDDKYEVSNRKWMLNDYDNNGWTTIMPEADKPMPTYVAEFDDKVKALRPLPGDNKPRLFLGDEKIYWGELRALEYAKVD